MDKVQEAKIKQLVRDVRAGVAELSGQFKDGTDYEVNEIKDTMYESNDYVSVTIGKEKYNVMGQKRLRVAEIKAVKKVKEQINLERVCAECGTVFTASKFTPYLITCPECRKKTAKAGGAVMGYKPVTCIECGKEFKVNLYDYNTKRCSKCVK